MSRPSRHPTRLKRRNEPRQLILAKGDEVTVIRLRGWMIGAGVLVLLATTFWLTATTAYIFFRDDVLAAVLARQTRMQHAYEDRIATLRLQIDRVTSRQLLDQEAFVARMDELIRRQAAVESRANAMTGLVDRARQSGLVPPALPTREGETIVTGSILPALRSATDRGARIQYTLDGVQTSLERLMAAQDSAIARIESRSREQQGRIVAVVRDLGLDPERIAGPRLRAPAPTPAPAPPTVRAGLGGPFLPATAAAATAPIDSIEQRARRAQDEMDYLERLKRGLSVVPVRKPVHGTPEITSGFGTRRDPFLGVMAMHTGIDFRGDTGEPVLAAAAGTITTAGRNGGYGLMVEIDHGNGLSTRYGHLSHIAVREGQRVPAGHQIGRIGSTGRSTGPHLHYETRIEGDAVNPDRFVRAGQRLGLW